MQVATQGTLWQQQMCLCSDQHPWTAAPSQPQRTCCDAPWHAGRSCVQGCSRAARAGLYGQRAAPLGLGTGLRR